MSKDVLLRYWDYNSAELVDAQREYDAVIRRPALATSEPLVRLAFCKADGSRLAESDLQLVDGMLFFVLIDGIGSRRLRRYEYVNKDGAVSFATTADWDLTQDWFPISQYYSWRRTPPGFEVLARQEGVLQAAVRTASFERRGTVVSRQYVDLYFEGDEIYPGVPRVLARVTMEGWESGHYQVPHFQKHVALGHTLLRVAAEDVMVGLPRPGKIAYPQGAIWPDWHNEKSPARLAYDALLNETRIVDTGLHPRMYRQLPASTFRNLAAEWHVNGRPSPETAYLRARSEQVEQPVGEEYQPPKGDDYFLVRESEIKPSFNRFVTYRGIPRVRVDVRGCESTDGVVATFPAVLRDITDSRLQIGDLLLNKLPTMASVSEDDAYVSIEH